MKRIFAVSILSIMFLCDVAYTPPTPQPLEGFVFYEDD